MKARGLVNTDIITVIYLENFWSARLKKKTIKKNLSVLTQGHMVVRCTVWTRGPTTLASPSSQGHTDK